MFNKKMKEQLKELQEFKESIISCDKCKQLIFKEDAIKQKSEIKRKNEWVPFGLRDPFNGDIFKTKEYIHNDYFCKRCNDERVEKEDKINKSKKK